MFYMKLFPNQQGFITNWLVSGNACTLYHPPKDLPQTWQDQLGYEKALRNVFFDKVDEMPGGTIALGEKSQNGEPWKYWYHEKSSFVDTSTFYTLLTNVRLDAATVLVSECEQSVQAVLWTYAAVDIWLNGVRVQTANPPVYKPIACYPVTLNLKQGENLIYILMQNLGVRDTRNLFGLELKQTDNLFVTLPDAQACHDLYAAEQWLDSLRYEKGCLYSQHALPTQASICTESEVIDLNGGNQWEIPAQTVRFSVQVCLQQQTLSRQFELLERIKPWYLTNTDHHYHQFLERLASQKVEPRGNGKYFGAFHVMARLQLGISSNEDEELLMHDLEFIESCGDCADFLVMALVRLVKNYPVSDKFKKRLKEVFLGFRYWMDESGEDGMCFWSENHALMFYGCQLAVGRMFENEVFVRSGRTGKEQAEIAEKRCRQWLDDVEKEGVEEFNSATYMPVTVAALLNLIDFAPKDIADRATKILDSLLRQLCLHVFQQSVISPQGRVYRDVIYPNQQSAQTLLHLIDPSLPYSYKESIWCVCFATSRYTFPEDLKEIMQKEASTSYLSGNARIELEKTVDYMLTSVRSPRDETDAPHWQNLCFVENADRTTNTYVKSLNERFHGTSVFQPGVYGYQQHLWYAALSNEAVVFVTHPGSDTDFDSMRPGYWYGNGVMPAVLQKGAILGAIYQIPENHPIRFTHTFFPKCKFEQTEQNGNWLFAKNKQGYLALWSSEVQIPHNAALTDCEYRCYNTNTAYLCICGRAKEETFEQFKHRCKCQNPSYCKETSTLKAEGFILTYQPHENKTQFI